MPASKSGQLQKNFLKWYRENARDLPWRRTQDPYAIWVSEIMLQQTQVQTVIAYYERWLARFPTIESLASADLHDVLAVWAGLGYYRRARMIHEAAKEIMDRHKGLVPETVEGLMNLPGIGRYTAGAIASIAFEKQAPVLDGNVVRVLTRIYAVKEDVSSAGTQKRLWALAAELLPEKKPGDLNQALMELGATVCFPLNPACSKCPVSSLCEARKENRQTAYPVKKEKEKLQRIKTFAMVMRSGGKVLMRRQPDYGRWGGLWMFPHWTDKSLMCSETGLKEAALKPFTLIEHGFTKYKVTLRVYEHEVSELRQYSGKLKAGEDSDSRWIEIEEAGKLPVPAPHKKILKEVTVRYAAATA